MATSPEIEAIFKRCDRRDGRQSLGMSCLICGKNFDTCSHSMGQVELIVDAWKLMNTLGRKRAA